MSIQHQAKQGREQGRHDAVAEDVGPGGQAVGQQTLGQLKHQLPLFRMVRERDAHVRQLVHQASTHGPVEFAHERQLLVMRGRDGRAAEAFELRTEYRDPRLFTGGQAFGEAFESLAAVLAPSVLRLPGIRLQIRALLGRQEIRAAFGRQTPDPDKPGQQQAKADL